MSDAPTRMYGVVDTARDPRLYPLVIRCPRHTCLFAGELEAPLKEVAPYLVEMTNDSPMWLQWRDDGWGQAWGIVIWSSLDLQTLRKHLRQFLLAQLPDGQIALFRFYDPRVWRDFWPTCSAEQQSQWLAGLSEVVAESETSTR